MRSRSMQGVSGMKSKAAPSLVLCVISSDKNALYLTFNVLSTEVLLGTLVLRLQVETGPPFYVVIGGTRRSSHLQGKGSTFISHLFKTPSIVRPRESNPRPPTLQSSALLTDLSSKYKSFHIFPYMR